MKKIVSLVMAVVMCLSIAIVGTTSVGAKTTKTKFNYSNYNIQLLSKVCYLEVGNTKNTKLKKAICSSIINNYETYANKKSFKDYLKSNKYVSYGSYLIKNFNKIKINTNCYKTAKLIKSNPRKYKNKGIKYFCYGKYLAYSKPAYRIGNIYFSK